MHIYVGFTSGNYWGVYITSWGFCLAMEAPYDGSEVTIVMEEIESAYAYASPVPSKKKKKYRSPGNQGEKTKKPR